MSNPEPAALWERAREILAFMLNLFGEPAEIAGRGTIGRVSRRLMRDWLASLERLVRRLLLLAALGLALAPVRAAAGRSHARLARIFSPDDPAAWPACLRLFHRPRERRHVAVDDDDDDEHPRPVDARPFALRLEALRRILASPDKRVRLVARALARLRARSANSPRTPAVRPWLIPAARRTDAEDAVHDAMLAIEPLIEAEFARWEPG